MMMRMLFQLVYALAVFLLLLMRSGFGLNSSIAGAGDGIEVSRCIERERQALLAFKQGVIDDSGRLSGWGSEDDKNDCCTWEGVECSNTTRNGAVFIRSLLQSAGRVSASYWTMSWTQFQLISFHPPKNVLVLKNWTEIQEISSALSQVASSIFLVLMSTALPEITLPASRESHPHLHSDLPNSSLTRSFEKHYRL